MAIEDDWLWGWDPTPGIVSVWAESDGRATVWRRVDGVLVREDVRFRPWLLLDRADDLPRNLAVRELANSVGDGALRFVVRADDYDQLTAAVARARHVGHIRDLGNGVLVLPPDEQYLVASGRNYFRELAFDELVRCQIDLETTGLDPARDRVFLIALRAPDGRVELLEDADEAALIARLVARVRALDPDVIENHNLHGFDLPFLERRAQLLGVPLVLGRTGGALRRRGARRGRASETDPTRRIRFVAPGRELIDTLDAVLRHDFATRDLGDHSLKAVARTFGLATGSRTAAERRSSREGTKGSRTAAERRSSRELIPGDRVHAEYVRDPERVRRYATADVDEVAGLARLLGGPAFALARMVPRRYERLADAGPATGVIDPLLVRAYLRSGEALPAYAQGDGTTHTGAGLHVFATGVARRIVKADVASLYPSLMRAYRIGPARDRLGAMLALVDRLVEQRLAAKACARAAPAGSRERHAAEAMSAAMKLVVNSAYGYLGAGSLTRFADIHAANEVTRRGREVLARMCDELAARGVTLLEADTDGVYFAVPAGWTEADERRVVAEVAALLPERVQLEFDGRYAAMLSHEPKNYALLGYDGKLALRGVAFRSSRAEPYGEAFLRAALAHLLAGDVPGVRAAYVDAIAALRGRTLPTAMVATRVALAKSREDYAASARREAAYEAMLAGDRAWQPGARVRVYLRSTGPAILDDDVDPRDYDVDHYVKQLRDQFAARLARAFTADDHATVFGDPVQLTLFSKPISTITTLLAPEPPPRR